MSEWIEWTGGECPVEKNQRVDVRYRTGQEAYYQIACGFFWTGFDEDGSEHPADIIAYRVVKEKEA